MMEVIVAGKRHVFDEDKSLVDGLSVDQFIDSLSEEELLDLARLGFMDLRGQLAHEPGTCQSHLHSMHAGRMKKN